MSRLTHSLRGGSIAGMGHVVGVDSSTQSTKVAVYDADDGSLIELASAPHPDGTEVDPAAWEAALRDCLRHVAGAEAISVAAQQHGMVLLDPAGTVLRPALLWNDLRSAPQAEKLVAELGGPQPWADAVGSVPVASYTVTKLRWVAENEPDVMAAAASVALPHDWLTWLLCGRGELVTDRGDASGTGYWSPATGDYRPDLLERAAGRELSVPRVAAPDERVGTTPEGLVVAAGTGDNMGAALGLGLQPGDVAVSLGTSGTVFGVAGDPTADGTGAVSGFADASGQFLPLVCTLNAARVLAAAAAMLRVDSAGFDSLALAAPPGAGGLVLLPYLDGERVPNLPGATGSLVGLTRGNATPENLARAAVEGMLCGLADGMAALQAQGMTVRRALLIGGGARSLAVQAAAADIFGVPVVVPEPGEYVARGAAVQAAWALQGGGAPPRWPLQVVAEHEPSGGSGEELLARYRAAVARHSG